MRDIQSEGHRGLVTGRMWWGRERGKSTVMPSGLTWGRSRRGRAEKGPSEVAFEKSLVSSARAVRSVTMGALLFWLLDCTGTWKPLPHTCGGAQETGQPAVAAPVWE